MPSARRCRRLAAFGWAALIGAATLPAPPAFAQLADPNDDAPIEEDADGRIPIERAIRFDIRGNDLAIASDLTVDDGARLVQLRGLEGTTRVTIARRLRGPMGFVPYLELSHYGPPSEGSKQISIRAQATAVQMTCTTRTNDANTTVTLSQDSFPRRGGRIAAVAVEPRNERVRLTVRQRNGADEQRYAAPTFAELLRKHPGPAARYLAPVFRDFGQDAAVFGVDASVAWQLFPDAVEPDAATASTVLALLDRLDESDFRRREVATAELDALGGPAVALLGEVDRATLSPEQNARVDAILSRYTQLDDEEVAALQADPEFLLRCFVYSEVQPVRAAAARAVGRVVPGEPPVELDSRADAPARAKAADAVRARLPE